MVTPVQKFSRKHISASKIYGKLLSGNKTSFRSLALYIGLVSSFFLVIGFVVLYFTYLHSLPSISEIEQDTLLESTIIYDKNGGELYNLYSKEKRTYIAYDRISEKMRDAIIATEDKTFFENQGIDFRGLVRSWVNYLVGKTDKIQGTSTISQQLIKNTFLTNERSFARKFKEIYLSYRLNSEYSKEKILELYLNKISFGNNAFGIEEASKTYFGKSAKDVGILGSTILASLPKGPTYYSPYSHRDRLMGYLYVYDQQDKNQENKIFLDSTEKMKEYKTMIDGFKKIIADMKMERSGDDLSVCGVSSDTFKKDVGVDKNGCTSVGYKDLLDFLNSIRVSGEISKASTTTGTGKTLSWSVRSSAKMYLEYNTGRKDFVASRMLEDEKISVEEFKNVVIGGLDFQFKKYSENIKYPYFVFYVRDYLENKYGKDFESQGGLRIYTTIDPSLQDKAEEIVRKQVKVNISKYGASSAALVSLDNKTGQILSMVGGPDYFDEEHGGNVNMITSRRQPGSSFKPIEYALAMSKEAISPDTPIYDVDTSFGKWNPDNYDQKFLGKMKVRTALDYSRNIPAIKMFYVAGGESSVVKFARSLGLVSLDESGNYGAPLSIGTGEVKPLEMLSAYSVFANGGWKKEITPILRIEDKKGNIIEKSVIDPGKYIFSDAASYLLSVILSDAKSRPGDFWNNVLTLKDRAVAAKTGTSNKDVSENGVKKILPRDLWTAGYTPQITTVVWAGNVDGTETKGTCDGLNCAAPIWHDYMEFAHKWLPKEEFKKPESIYTATISAISGKLASENTPESLRVTSMFAVKPTAYENSMKQIEVDSLCNGKITDATPEGARKKGYLVDVNPIIDGYDKDWLGSIRGWIASEAGWAYFSSGSAIITNYKDQICERPGVESSRVDVKLKDADGSTRSLGPNLFDVTYAGDNPVVKVLFARDGEVFKEVAVEGEKKNGSLRIAADLDIGFSGEHVISVTAVDSYGYSGKESKTIQFTTGKTAPVITLTQPNEGTSPRIYPDIYFNIRFTVQDSNEIIAANLYIDGKLETPLGGGNSFVVPVNEKKNLTTGRHTATVEVIDATRAKATKDVIFEVIDR